MDAISLQFTKTDTGVPSEHMTDEEWQKMFILLKLATQPSKQKRMTTYNSQCNVDKYTHTYCGDTLDQNWRKMLNDVLKQIRSGERDYVYYTYNIVELLKYERERLRSRYIQSEQYFEIWLEN